MMRSRLTLLVIVLLVLCLVAVAAACTQQDSPGPGSSPTAQATDTPEATPTLNRRTDLCATAGCSSNGYADAGSNHWGNSYPGGRSYS